MSLDPNCTFENAFKDTIDSLKSTCEGGCKQCEDRIREAPIVSVAIAGAVGYLLHFLPVFAILSALLRVVSALIKPAIVVLGAYKVYEYVQSRAGGEGSESKSEVPAI